MAKGRKPTLFGAKCTDCSIVLDKSNCVYTDTHIRRKCRKCWTKQWNSYVPEQKREWAIARQYGLNTEEYNRKLELQLGGCAICKQPCKSGHKLSVDHNHETGEIRDLLCKRCNLIIGMVNEDDGLLFDIIEYLKRHSRVSLKIVS